METKKTIIQAIALWIMGSSYESVGLRLGIAKSTVSNFVHDYLDSHLYKGTIIEEIHNLFYTFQSKYGFSRRDMSETWGPYSAIYANYVVQKFMRALDKNNIPTENTMPIWILLVERVKRSLGFIYLNNVHEVREHMIQEILMETRRLETGNFTIP